MCHLLLGYLGVGLGQQPSLFAFKAHVLYSKSGFLSLTTIGILEWIILWGDRGHYRMLSSIPVFYPLDVSSTPPVVTNTVKCPLWSKITPYLGHMRTTGLNSTASQFCLQLQESTIPLLQLGGDFGILPSLGSDPLFSPGHMPLPP